MSLHVSEVNELVHALQTRTKDLKTSQDINLDRRRALAAARKVVKALESPEEVIDFYASEVEPHRMAIRMGVDLGLFHILAHAREPQSAAQLAKEAKAEEHLIVRVMRVLCSINFARQADATSYLATPLTKAMTDPASDGAIYTLTEYNRSGDLPAYFHANGYRCPTDSMKAPFQWSHQTDKHYWTKLHESARGRKAFNDYMGGIRGQRRFWADWYDVQTRLLDGFEWREREALLVDVGGGQGYDAEAFVERFPDASGHVIVQDIEATVAPVKETLRGKGIRAMGYDFLQDQPIKGARIYFVHFCLHHWPVEDCRTILTHLKEAMAPDYSRLILNEAVLPDVDCPSWCAAMDINMMANLAGEQRNQKQWLELIDSVGLKVTNIQISPDEGDGEAVIECVVKDE